MIFNKVAVSLVSALMLSPTPKADAFQGRREQPKVVSSRNIEISGSAIQMDIGEGKFDLGEDAVLRHVEDGAKAVVTYFGRFPVARARVLVVPVADRHGVFQGTTWGNMRGVPAFTRIRVGEQTTEQELTDDWMVTHELVHMAFPSLADEHHWMEEGMATYVEPIARVQAGQLDAKTIWSDMMDGMPKGEPGGGDEGLDRTRTWGRTYWGGALFCLVADVEIRKQTKDRKGLQDALRAIVAAGGSIDQEWTIEKAFAVGDQATGTQVLSTTYAKWKSAPVDVDLDAFWKDIGVRRVGAGVEFDPKARFAKIREAITRKPD
jgi:hypothetical protein